MKTKNNIKQNNLSLKSLQAELDALKKQTDTTQYENITAQLIQSDPTQVDTKNKQNIVSSVFKKGVLPIVWLFTFIIGYMHKIPIISKIINGLSIWYGKTTWWIILSNIRKAFVVFNALIGVFAMINSINFTDHTFLATLTILVVG